MQLLEVFSPLLLFTMPSHSGVFHPECLAGLKNVLKGSR